MQQLLSGAIPCTDSIDCGDRVNEMAVQCYPRNASAVLCRRRKGNGTISAGRTSGEETQQLRGQETTNSWARSARPDRGTRDSVSGPTLNMRPSLRAILRPSLRGAKRRCNPASIFSSSNEAGLLRFARNDGDRLQPCAYVLAALHARSFPDRSALEKTEGAGKTGCALHPRSRVQNARVKMRTRAYRFSGDIRPSLRNGFTAYRELSPAIRICLSPSPRELLAGPTRLGRLRLRGT